MSKRGSGSSARKSSFGNISIGGGYKTSQETIDIARKAIETNTKSKNVPDWAVHEYLVNMFNSNQNQKEGEEMVRLAFDEKRWKKTRKGAKDYPKTKEEQRKIVLSAKGRSEAEIISSTYERARKRANKNFDKWFGRGMGK